MSEKTIEEKAAEVDVDPTSRVHLKQFWEWLLYYDCEGAGPSVGALMYNDDLYPVDEVIDLYVDWLRTREG